MRLPQRILLIIYTLVLAVVSLAVALLAAGVALPSGWLQFDPSLMGPAWRWGIVAGGLLVFLLGMYAIFGGLQKAAPSQAPVKRTELGEVIVTYTALESIILRAGRQVAGVREVKTKIKFLPEGIAVSLEAVVAPEANVPAVAEELQTRVQQQLRDSAGIQALEVRVVVHNIANELRSRLE